MGKLSVKARNALPASIFAGPDRSYPIPDAAHARNALARSAQNATPAERARIAAKVHARFPGMGSQKNALRKRFAGGTNEVEATDNAPAASPRKRDPDAPLSYASAGATRKTFRGNANTAATQAVDAAAKAVSAPGPGLGAYKADQGPQIAPDPSVGRLGYRSAGATRKKFAMGTAQVGGDPPKPGDTTTSGDWGSGGQNQTLRKRIFGGPKGMTDDGGMGDAAYAGGTSRVPGTGSPKVDKVKAILAPGEAVLNKPAADMIGRNTIANVNNKGRSMMGMPSGPQAAMGAGGGPTQSGLEQALSAHADKLHPVRRR